MSFLNIYDMKYKNPDNIVVKINNKEKHKLSLNKIQINEALNKNYISSKLFEKKIFDDINELIDSLASINVIHLLKETHKENEYFQCLFYKNNVAWISRNSEGKYRYFTKNRNKVTFMDSVDLLQIFYKCKNNSATLNEIIKNHKINFIKDEWINSQRMKYMLNFNVIHSWKKYEEEFPNLSSLITEHLKIYETLNVLGNLLVKKEKFNVDGDNVFFVSNSYVSEFCGISQGKANKIINLFAVLGLIKKINEQDLPAELIIESKEIARRRALGNVVMYYTIPNVNDVLSTAEEQSSILVSNKIDYKNVSKKMLDKVFGKEFANEIYPQIIQKNKIKSIFIEDEKRLFYDEYEKIIIEAIESKSFCTKQDLFDKLTSELSKYKKESMFNEFQKNILKNNSFKYIKPTKEMKTYLNVSTSQYMFVEESFFNQFIDYK